MLNPHRDIMIETIKSIQLIRTRAALLKLQAEIEEAPEEVQEALQVQCDLIDSVKELLETGLDTADTLSSTTVAFSLN
jgi:hypothetical protein